MAARLDAISDAIWVVQMPGATVSYINETCLSFYGYESDYWLYNKPAFRQWENLVHPEDKQSAIAIFNKFLSDETQKEAENTYRIIRKDGQVRWVYDRYSKHYDESGQLAEIIGVARDVTVQRQLGQDYRNQNELLKGISKATTEFLVSGNSRTALTGLLETVLQVTGSQQGFIGEWIYNHNNEAVLRVHACSEELAQAMNTPASQPGEQNPLRFGEVDHLFGRRAKEPEVVICNEPASDEKETLHRQGFPNIVNYMLIPVQSAGIASGVIGLANRTAPYNKLIENKLQPAVVATANIFANVRRDTQRQQDQKKLETSEQRWRMAIAAMMEGVWDIDLKTGRFFLSEMCRGLLRIDQKLSDSDTTALHVFFESLPVLMRRYILRTYLLLQQSNVSESVFNGEFNLKLYHQQVRKSVWIAWRCAVLRDDHGQIVRITGSLKDITDQKTTLLQLERIIDRQRAHNDLRANFVTIASHEFRSPIATIQTSIDLLRMVGNKLEDKHLRVVEKHTQRVDAQIKRLTSILDEVLLLGKIESDAMEFNPANLSVQEIVQEISDTYKDIEDERELIIHPPENNGFFWADPVLLRVILQNLVSNAFKYSQGRPAPEFKAKISPAEVVFEIQDYGIGIPEKDRESIFKPFFRAANTRSLKGFGIGLAITYELIRKHNGRLLCKSEVNKYTKFTLILPRTGLQNEPVKGFFPPK